MPRQLLQQTKAIIVPILVLAALASFVPHSFAQPAGIDEDLSLEGFFTEISGKYTSRETGLRIEFPDGWSGLGFGEMAIVVPGGLDTSSEENAPKAAMIVMALPRAEFSGAFSSIEAFKEGVEESASDQHCTVHSYSYTKINSIDGIRLIVECDTGHGNEEGGAEYSHVSMYGIMSESAFILIAFAAQSSNDYNDHVDSFEQSISSVRVDNAIPFKTAMAQVLNLDTLNHAVSVKGGQIDLKVQSNSDVNELTFSESHKRLSVKVEGQDGTDGIIIIGVEKVLEGPYTVTIDGQATSDFVVAEDDVTGEKTVEISYSHSIHDIEITGTNVVPEFPPAALASILGIIGVLAILTRSKLL